MCVCVSIAAPSVRCIINAKRAEGGVVSPSAFCMC